MSCFDCRDGDKIDASDEGTTQILRPFSATCCRIRGCDLAAADFLGQCGSAGDCGLSTGSQATRNNLGGLWQVQRAGACWFNLPSQGVGMRLLVAAFALVMAMGMWAQSAKAASAYDDVPTDHWAYNALDYLTEK